MGLTRKLGMGVGEGHSKQRLGGGNEAPGDYVELRRVGRGV